MGGNWPGPLEPGESKACWISSPGGPLCTPHLYLPSNEQAHPPQPLTGSHERQSRAGRTCNSQGNQGSRAKVPLQARSRTRTTSEACSALRVDPAHMCEWVLLLFPWKLDRSQGTKRKPAQFQTRLHGFTRWDPFLAGYTPLQSS